MKNYFKVSGHFMPTYKIACEQRVLNIEDCRSFKKEYPSDISPYMVLNGKIHYKFFEQLTLQISPQISKLLNKEFEKDGVLTFNDRYFVVIDNNMYILLYLHWSEGIGDYLWVKCESIPECLSNIEERTFNFELCDERETVRCQLIRFGRTSEYWVDYINHSFSLYLKENQIDTSNCSYPDIIITCVFRKKVTAELKNQVFAFVSDFISSYNSNAQENSQIHDCQMIDRNLARKTSIHIDFGNCNPIALQSLSEALIKSKLGIKDIIIN